MGRAQIIRLAVVGVAALVTACALMSPLPLRGFEVPASWGYGRVRPSPQYREWWREAEECSGLSGSFDTVRWYVVLTPGFILDRAGPSAGFVIRPTRSVYLASRFAHRKDLVKHEALHLLLGRGGHPSPPFGKCAPTVIYVWR